MFWLWAALMWVGFAALAVGLGALRVLFLQPRVGEAVAHVVGTLACCVLFLVLIWRFVRWTKLAAPGLAASKRGAPGPHARARLVALGLFWTILTIAFEFGFGRLVMGHSWARLLADYNLLAGRLWVLVLLTLYFGPRLCAWVLARWRR